MILEAILKHPYDLGKYHFLPPGGGLLEFGGKHMNFGNQKGEHKDFWYLKGGGGDRRNLQILLKKVKKSKC